jgi:hypothetical protein
VSIYAIGLLLVAVMVEVIREKILGERIEIP